MDHTRNRIGVREAEGASEDHRIEAVVIEMLYQDKTLGRTGVLARLAARFAGAFSALRQADVDIATISPHLRRDLGVYDADNVASPWDYVWRK
jgi:hypothetical protein